MRRLKGYAVDPARGTEIEVGRTTGEDCDLKKNAEGPHSVPDITSTHP